VWKVLYRDLENSFQEKKRTLPFFQGGYHFRSHGAVTKKEKKGGIKEGTKQEAQVLVLLPERQSRFSIV
jgi:hypothetical protein